MSRLVDFYRGEGTDAEGRALAEIWAFSDGQMEAIHDFIQWLFPLREASRFNPDAPLLTDTDVAAFRADPTLRANLLRSLDAFLGFLGLARDGIGIVEGPDFEARRDVWASPNHNWLRITRVLHCLRILGLDDEARDLFAFLERLHQGGTSGITPDTFGYWAGAARPDPTGGGR